MQNSEKKSRISKTVILQSQEISAEVKGWNLSPLHKGGQIFFGRNFITKRIATGEVLFARGYYFFNFAFMR